MDQENNINHKTDKNSQSEKKEKLSPGQFTKVIFWTFKIYFDMSPTKTVMMVVTRSLAELKGLVYAFIFSKVIDQLVAISQSANKDFTLIYPYLLALLIYYVFLDGLIDNLNRYSSRGLRRISTNELRKLLYQHLQTLGIQNLENPETVNRIQRSQEWLQNTFDLMSESVGFIANIVKTVATGFAIFAFLPFMIPVLIVLTLIMYFPDKYFTQKDFHWQVDNSEGRKQAGTSAYYLENPNNLQEVSVIGAYNFLNRKYVNFFSWFNSGLLSIYKKRETTNFFLNIADSTVSLFGYTLIFQRFILGHITLGTVTFQMRSLDIFSSSIHNLLSSVTFMNEFAIKMYDLVILLEMKPSIKDGTRKLPISKKPPKIELINVSFKYPHSDKFVIRNLSLKIESGEKIALVGHNGAGKTTLIKLLSRIYQPTEGQIIINGIDLNDLQIKDWYKHLGVLFQDFNFYGNLSVKENITIGKSAIKVNQRRLINAAKNADAHDFIMEYKNQYEQLMSEKYHGGIRPSTGQQQKIAIARFFYRNAPLAIFDEPTAAIDAVSEYKIFNKIYRFFRNKTVIIISHRFSTVRNANRIIVLQEGKIVEEGSHSELVNLNGIYSHAFKLQAEGYQN